MAAEIVSVLREMRAETLALHEGTILRFDEVIGRLDALAAGEAAILEIFAARRQAAYAFLRRSAPGKYDQVIADIELGLGKLEAQS